MAGGGAAVFAQGTRHCAAFQAWALGAVRTNNQSKPALAQYLHALAAIKIIPILAGRRTGQNCLVDVGATGWLAFMAAHHNQSIF